MNEFLQIAKLTDLNIHGPPQPRPLRQKQEVSSFSIKSSCMTKGSRGTSGQSLTASHAEVYSERLSSTLPTSPQPSGDMCVTDRITPGGRHKDLCESKKKKSGLQCLLA